ncbi:inositol monophosphatase family protein [Dermacoccaceae bacterium W4C1]
MDTDAVLDMLREVAAEIITPRFRALADDQVREKNPGDLVTVADTEAEVAITARLLDAYPEAVVVGEEATAADPSLLEGLSELDHWFTVDPVDGTKNFVHGSANHAVMVAEMRGSQTVRSWIWQPELRTAFVAERGAGAFRDGQRIQTPPESERPRGVTSKRKFVGEVLGDLAPLQISWVCCGVDYPSLAQGVADFIVYSATMPWDHAPGSLLLEEVGGRSTFLDGTPYTPTVIGDGLLAANSVAVHERVLPLLPSR